MASSSRPRSGCVLEDALVGEHVEDLVAERLALLLELVEQALEDLALAGLVGHQVPEVADLGLADAVDAPEALLDAVRVPGQVVVHHQVGALQVDALARGVGGHQHEGVLVLGEVLLRLAALLAADAAVDGDHGLRPAEHDADLLDQVVERVAVLGEDDELAAVAVHVEHLAVVLQQARELLPLLVAAGDAHLVGELLQAGQRDDLVLQLLDGLRRRGLVDDLLLELLELLVGQVVELFEVFDVELGGDGADGEQRLGLLRPSPARRGAAASPLRAWPRGACGAA